MTRVAVFLLCFGSIWTLLGFLWRLAPMHVLGALLLVPSLVVLVGIHAWARKGDPALSRDMTAGWWGGLWGTLGYDVIRVPFHLLGFTPFQPIRSYGMFVVDAPRATVATDLAGVAYHFSNGLTFGVMYAVVMSGRHWAWGVLWGLVLETLAVLTPFGAVYGVRQAWAILFVAYFAHLYYGLPLGVAVQSDERLRQALASPRVRWGTGVVTAAVVAFLVLAWEPVTAVRPPPRTVDLGPHAIVAGWTRVPVDEPLVLRNADALPVAWTVGDQRGVLDPGASVEVRFATAALRQLRVDGHSWRSVGVSVERDGFPAEPGTW